MMTMMTKERAYNLLVSRVYGVGITLNSESYDLVKLKEDVIDLIGYTDALEDSFRNKIDEDEQ